MDWVATWEQCCRYLRELFKPVDRISQRRCLRAREMLAAVPKERDAVVARGGPQLRRTAPWSEGQRQRSYLRAGNNASSQIGLERALLEQAEEDQPRRGRGVAGGQSTSCDGRCSQ